MMRSTTIPDCIAANAAMTGVNTRAPNQSELENLSRPSN